MNSFDNTDLRLSATEPEYEKQQVMYDRVKYQMCESHICDYVVCVFVCVYGELQQLIH